MKSYLIFGFVIFILFSINASAHSPSSMSINYDKETKMLSVSITHIVDNPEDHYIYNITIEKNNNFYKSFDYTSQPSSSSFTYNYNDIDSINGDMFSVTARCIKGGQISKSLTVGSSTGDTNTPGFEIIFFIFAIALILFWKANKIK